MVQTSLKAKMLEAFRARMYVYTAGIALFFIIILFQLINLQLVKGSEYTLKAKYNMENNIPIPATRGEIYDKSFKPGRGNVILASNRPSFNITSIPASFESKKKFRTTALRLAKLLGVSVEEILEETKGKNPWERIVLVEDVDFNMIVKIASHKHLFPHIDWEDAPVRVYNHGELFSHVTGYIGSINQKEYSRLREKGYRNYHKIGKSGIEKEYDTLLRGTDGYLRRIVDVRNRTEGEAVGLHPVSGNNLVLTLDYDVQKAAHEALGDKNGAVIVINPGTGEILSLVSKPDYDPNRMVSRINSKEIRKMLLDKQRPFLNRVIRAKYPPASTFILVTAISALETEKSYPGKTYFCPGKYTLKGYRDKDFYDFQAHGTVDLYGAIAKSCCVYFYNLGYKVGPTDILRYASYFGLNEKSGIDLPGELAGFIPSKKWKMRIFGQPWFDGDTINLSIGQGFLNVTPVGMANFISAIVNKGIVYKPHIVREIRSPDNSRVIRKQEREKLREIPLSPLTIRTVQLGMRMGVTGGTSMRLKYLKVPVAGKTGSAQTRSNRTEKYSQHAWFVGFGPYGGAPEKSVVMAVLVEYGIAGAASAVPIAERIFATLHEKNYFN